MKIILSLIFLLNFATTAVAATQPTPAPANRVASMYISQDFINEQLAAHTKANVYIKEMKVVLDPTKNQMFLRGKIQVPLEEMRAVNLDPKLGLFRFQVTIRPETSKGGHLILEFPLAESFFYPDSSKDPEHERVVIPVQMLSIALASARGYLAAISGDFSGFDRRTEKLNALLKSVDHEISVEKNSDARDDMKNQQEALKLQLAAIPLERKQLQSMSKEVESILGFTGEKELNLNEELGARKNALILKLKLSQLAPYLDGTELGGIRVLLDKKDGGGQNYLAVDINSVLEGTEVLAPKSPRSNHAGSKIAPALIMRMNQSLFESKAVVDTEKKDMGDNLRNMQFDLKDDGLHVSGEWHKLFFNIGFDTLVDFVSTGPDVFEVRVRKLDVAGIDLGFLRKFVLESMKKRLNARMKGICKFKYIGEETDDSRALQVSVDPKTLVPAFPDLHLVDVDVRDREFLMKIGKI
jgi:hypothetical protein